MNLKNIAKIALGAVFVFLVLAAFGILKLPRIILVSTTRQLKPTMLQIKEINDIVKLNSAFYVGEVVVSYAKEMKKSIETNRNQDISKIEDIYNKNQFHYAYLNEYSKNFLNTINFNARIDDNITNSEVFNLLENWRLKFYLNRSDKEIEDYSKQIIARIHHFQFTISQCIEGECFGADEMKSAAYNLKMMNIGYKEQQCGANEKRIIFNEQDKLRSSAMDFNCEKTIKQLLNGEFRHFEKKVKSQIQEMASNAERYSTLVQFVNRMIQNREKIGNDKKLKLLLLMADFYEFKSDIDLGRLKKTIDNENMQSSISQIVKNIKGNCFGKIDYNEVAILARGKVVASFNLKEMKCFYSGNEGGVLFCLLKKNENEEQPEVKAIVNPYLFFDGVANINGFEIIFSESDQTDLILNNSILGFLKTQAKKQLEMDARDSGIAKDALVNAEKTLLGLVAKIDAKNPGKISRVSIIYSLSDIDRNRFGSFKECVLDSNGNSEWRDCQQ